MHFEMIMHASDGAQWILHESSAHCREIEHNIGEQPQGGDLPRNGMRRASKPPRAQRRAGWNPKSGPNAGRTTKKKPAPRART